MVRTESYRIMDGTEYETRVHVYDSERSGPTTMVTGGLHGNEPSGYLAADRIANWEVTSGRLVVIPRCNVPAITRQTRYNDNGDLNRQFPPRSGEPRTPLARAIWNEVVAHDPDWMFDLHSARGIYKSGDGSVGQAMFPTWTDPARTYGDRAVADLNQRFGFSGDMAYLMGNTLDADRDMLMHRVAGLLDVPGYICETTRKETTTSEQVDWQLYSVEHVMNQYGHERGAPPSSSSITFDAGMVTLDDYWQTYDMETRFSHPAIVAPAMSYNGSDPAHPRIGSLTGRSFDARVEEWPYLNQVHLEERAGYLVFNPGSYTTATGQRIDVGRRQVDHRWENVSFDRSFSNRPVLFAMPQSASGADPIVARIRNSSRSGFDVRLQEEDSGHETEVHKDEVVTWMAFEPGRGTLGGRQYEARTTTTDESWRRLEFSRSYQNPVFIADVMSYNGWNAVGVRWRNLTSSGVDVFVEEEQSEDPETNHADEIVSYLVVEG